MGKMEKIGKPKGVGWKCARILLSAGLLSAGMSMTSLAAPGWQEESGTWVYYNENGSAAVNQWQSSNNSWYYLDSEGLMATGKLIEDDGDYYYVDENGVMVTNQWVRIENTDEYNEDDPEYWYYYFQGNGKAYKAPEDGRTLLRTINEKKYAFTAEGRMLFGWVDDDSTRRTDDDGWTECLYYMGNEDDGAASVGWMQIHVVDNNTERWDRVGDASEDQDYWFYFQTNGKKLCAKDDDALKYKEINGRKYGFDETGRMVYEWVQAESNNIAGSGNTGSSYPSCGNSSCPNQDSCSCVSSTIGSNTCQCSGSSAPMPDCNSGSTNSGTGSSSTHGYVYYGPREDGARLVQGWFKVVPDPGINSQDNDDLEERWFYASSAGKLCASEFKTIKGRRYAFDNSGRMLSGLQAIYMDSLGRMWNQELDEKDLMDDATAFMSGGGRVTLKLIDETGREAEEELPVRDAILNAAFQTDNYGGNKEPYYGIYYFGGPDDGAARTGKIQVEIEGDKYSFNFLKTGSKKFRGINGIDDKKLYREGMLTAADVDIKYEAYFTAEEPEDIRDISSEAYQSNYQFYCEEPYSYILPGRSYKVAADEVNRMVQAIEDGTVKVKNNRVFIVKTTGSIVSGDHSGVQDGDGCYYEVKNGKVVSYYEKDEENNKVLIR